MDPGNEPSQDSFIGDHVFTTSGTFQLAVAGSANYPTEAAGGGTALTTVFMEDSGE